MLRLEGKVALQLQYHSRLLQSGDRADARYVINNQTVCRPHVFGAQEIDAKQLRAGHGEAGGAQTVAPRAAAQ